MIKGEIEISKNKALDKLVTAGELKSYSLITDPNDSSYLTLVFPSGFTLTIDSNCGSGYEANSWLIIEEKVSKKTEESL